MNIVERQFCVLHVKHTLNLIITMTDACDMPNECDGVLKMHWHPNF